MGANEFKMEQGLIIGLALIALIILAFVVGVRISNFCYELRYLNMELGRCSAGERSKWLRRRRDLWLNLFFPFYKR